MTKRVIMLQINSDVPGQPAHPEYLIKKLFLYGINI